ncbi:uncharacterized protein LOC111602167 [Drosophila hydei]|uniref:Uncharacterized protein LOC111602167 n=1 Tax=Drosophila hydei TaxID=7224 RepID=A0A6J1M4K6_DROHY|nr:uncharacterized protein LOC111602167 [Drosophila hydei]
MRVYYEDSYRCGYYHRHNRPNIEIDVFSGWGGSYYQAPIARPEVVVVNQAPTYVPPVAAGPMMMPQPYGGMSVATTGYYQQQQQQTYQYQQQYPHANNPPYPQW